jgi:hypothetical protein
MRCWVPLLRVDKMRKLCWIAQKEHRCVVRHNIPIALVCSELYRETPRVASTIMRTRLATHCREANSDGARLALLEDVCYAQVFKRVCGCIGTMSSRTLGVDDTLWNALAVEMRKKVDEVMIL